MFTVSTYSVRSLNVSMLYADKSEVPNENMASKTTYHHGDLRQGLIEAALSLLQTKDVKSLSLRQVARQAGVSHTAPYRHFADKASLLAAVAEEGFTEFGQYLQQAVDQAKAEPIASLKATGLAYVRFAIEHPTHFRVMFSHFPSEPIEGSNLPAIADSTFQILVDVITSGQAAGLFKAGDPKELAVSRWALGHGLSMLLLDGMIPLATNPTQDAECFEPDALVESVIGNSLAGILRSHQ